MPTWSMVVNSPAGRPVGAASLLGELVTGEWSRRATGGGTPSGADHPLAPAVGRGVHHSRPVRAGTGAGRRPILSGSPGTARSARSAQRDTGRQRRRPALEAPMPRSVIVSGARTPMGRLLGSLKDFSAADLGGIAIKAALERAGISGDQVDYVI